MKLFFRLFTEVQHLTGEIERNKSFMEHCKTQIDILERNASTASRVIILYPIHSQYLYIIGNDTSEIVIRASELSQLLEEMRLLRRDLEQSIEKQKDLQMKLDENIRQSRSPREFTFSGRGVSYPELRIIDASGSIDAENLSVLNIDDRISRPIDSSPYEYIYTHYSQQPAGESEQRSMLRRGMRLFIIRNSFLFKFL